MAFRMRSDDPGFEPGVEFEDTFYALLFWAEAELGEPPPCDWDRRTIRANAPTMARLLDRMGVEPGAAKVALCTVAVDDSLPDGVLVYDVADPEVA